MGTIVENIEDISRDVKAVMASVRKVVGENEGEVAGGVASLKDTLAKLDRSLANIEATTR